MSGSVQDAAAAHDAMDEDRPTTAPSAAGSALVHDLYVKQKEPIQERTEKKKSAKSASLLLKFLCCLFSLLLSMYICSTLFFLFFLLSPCCLHSQFVVANDTVFLQIRSCFLVRLTLMIKISPLNPAEANSTRKSSKRKKKVKKTSKLKEGQSTSTCKQEAEKALGLPHLLFTSSFSFLFLPFY